MKISKDIQNLIDQKAIFVINHSGGKDSQAMYLYLTRELEIPSDQIQVIHAELTGVDWDGSIEHIEATISHPLHIVKAGKSFIDMVRSRNEKRPEAPSFPSPQYRQCTSDLKRDPINKWIRQYSKETGNKLIVSCIGIRAQESTNRAKKQVLKQNKRLSAAGRTVWEWLPVFDFLEAGVFDYIDEYGQKPFWTYAEGMSRKSCMFCIMASKKDLQVAAGLAPGHFIELIELEKEVNSTIFQGETLDQYAGINIAELMAKAA